MPLILSNFARTTLSSGLTNSATGVGAIQVADGSLFPSFGAGDYTYLVLEDSSKNREVIKIEGRSGNAIDISASGRAQDGTLARAWSAGDVVSLRLVRVMVYEILADILALDSGKEDAGVAAAAVAAHEADATDAHDASAVSFDNTGTALVATEAQAALEELDADLSAHEAETTGAHAASAISYGGSSGLSATDVEAALDELDSEKTTLAQVQAAIDASSGENYADIGAVSGAVAISMNDGEAQFCTLGGNVTFSFTDVPATAGKAYSLTLRVKNGASPYTITWPTIKWGNGSVPSLTATADAEDIFTFITPDNGTTWYGFVAGQAMA